MDRLRALDHIAYIRFVSVYQSFDDLEQLKQEVDALYAERYGARARPDDAAARRRRRRHAPLGPRRPWRAAAAAGDRR